MARTDGNPVGGPELPARFSSGLGGFCINEVLLVSGSHKGWRIQRESIGWHAVQGTQMAPGFVIPLAVGDLYPQRE